MGIADIKQMSMQERLATMELLWDSLRRGDVEPESPTWHRAVLNARTERIASGDAKFLTREELRRRFS
jgi:putative addiction module component (TIGR02574 family)